ncbi:hypothetical protein AAFF_G00217290 [Aldrovandia affinis]|uniref:Uncharacterized protein n=1 Tax=Aldrovandia affinis TaxID=143900 RepID=A0AAD7SVY2_9TELE|nr:hypothetical protein AAFF_G00217290 [Aldrovandia affinis]
MSRWGGGFLRRATARGRRIGAAPVMSSKLPEIKNTESADSPRRTAAARGARWRGPLSARILAVVTPRLPAPCGPPVGVVWRGAQISPAWPRRSAAPEAPLGATAPVLITKDKGDTETSPTPCVCCQRSPGAREHRLHHPTGTRTPERPSFDTVSAKPLRRRSRAPCGLALAAPASALYTRQMNGLFTQVLGRGGSSGNGLILRVRGLQRQSGPADEHDKHSPRVHPGCPTPRYFHNRP